MNLVSIIVPVYNSRYYLEDCVNSLINQTYKNIEIILVNDGSTDGSDFCCNQLAQKDNRIKVVHKENGGICSARNAGLQIATGNYIMFCDNDDDYVHDAVEKALGCIENMDVDFLKFCVDYRTVDEENKVILQQIQGYSNTEKCSTNEELRDNYIKIRESKALTYIWNGIYKMSLITKNKIQFDDHYKYGGEDFDFNYRCLIFSENIGFLDETLYVHYKRENHSTAAKYNRNQIEAVYLNYAIERKAVEKIFFRKCRDLEIYIMAKYFVGLISIFLNSKCDENNHFILEEYHQFYKKNELNKLPIIDLVMASKKDRKSKRYLMLLLLKCRMFRLITLYTVICKRKGR